MTKKGKTNATKKAHKGSASGNRTQKGKPSRSKNSRDMGGKSAKARTVSAPASKSRRSTAQFRIQPKRTFQVTDDEAEERLRFQAGKGKKLVSSTDTAKQVLLAGAKRAQRKFSRKKSGRYVARISLKWKSKNGNWVQRNLVQVSPTLAEAIEKLLQHDEINSLTYETFDHEDGDLVSGSSTIASKTKRISAVSFSKYSKRKYKKPNGKISKTSKSKKRSKKPRNVRRRKQQRKKH